MPGIELLVLRYHLKCFTSAKATASLHLSTTWYNLLVVDYTATLLLRAGSAIKT